MSADTVETQIGEAKLVPVVVLDNADDATPLSQALIAGGLPVAEVTFRTAAAEASIARMASDTPQMLVGAGTVTQPEQVVRAHDAGAKFVVTPGFNPAVVEQAQKLGLPIVPGANNPTAIELAMSFGLDLLKYFPAEPSGGVPFLKALAGPYGNVRFVPTGGISAKNVASYLALPNVLACGGSWMVDPKLIKAGQFDQITQLTQTAMDTVRAA